MAGLSTIDKLRKPTCSCWKAQELIVLLEIRPRTIVLPLQNGLAIEQDQDVVHNSELEQFAVLQLRWSSQAILSSSHFSFFF